MSVFTSTPLQDGLPSDGEDPVAVAVAIPATTSSSGASSAAYAAPSDGAADDAEAADLAWETLTPFPADGYYFPPSSAADSTSERDQHGFVPLRRCPRILPDDHPPRRNDTGDISAAGGEGEEESEFGAPLRRFPRPRAASSGATEGTVSPPLGFPSRFEGEVTASTPVRSAQQVSWSSGSRHVVPPPPLADSSVVQLLLTLEPASEEVLDEIAAHFFAAAEEIRRTERGFREFTMVHREEVEPQELLAMLA